jgi:hypothetical protein
MTETEQLEQFRQHTMAALRKIPYCRWYALEENEEALNNLALLGIAWLQDRVDNQDKRFSVPEFEEFMQGIVNHVPSLRQVRPEEPPPLPEIWKDPITGEVPKNPWSNPPDLASQAAVMERDPELAAWLRETVNGGVTYALLAKQREKAEAHLRKSAIKHGQPEWRTNPFRTSDLNAQASFIKEFGQEVADYFKHEALTPVKLPWALGTQNKTEIGRLTEEAPHIMKLAYNANELLRQRLTREAEQAKRESEEARQRQLEAEKKLRNK